MSIGNPQKTRLYNQDTNTTTIKAFKINHAAYKTLGHNGWFSKSLVPVASSAVTEIANKQAEKTRSSSQNENNKTSNNNPVATTTEAATTTIEGVKIEGYETLNAKQKENLHKQLKAYQDKIKASIADGSFDKLIESAFGRKVDNPAELEKLKKAALNGEWDKVIPKIKLGSQEDFSTATAGGKKVDAMGAFIKGSGEDGGTGTIILNTELLNGPITRNGQTISFQDILTEEIGHSWDVKLNKTDSQGDEGEAISILFKLATGQRENFLKALETMKAQGTNVDAYLAADKSISADLKVALKAYEAAKAQNDSGKMTITNADGTTSEIDVEFGWLQKISKAVKKAVRGVVKAATKVFTMPLRMMASILPAGNPFEKMVDTIDDAVDDALDAMEDLVEELEDLANKAWKKFEKNVLQSKWLGPVLMVMSFIPVLGTVAMVAQLALAAYQVGKGLETGDMSMVIGGVMSAVGGATAGGLISGATATTLATAAKTGYAAYNGYNAAKNGNWAGVAMAGVSIAGSTGAIDASTASNLQSGIGVADAIDRGDYVSAISQGVALAGNTGVIEKDTAKNIQQGMDMGKAIDDGDTAAAMRIATDYAGGTEWGKENKDTLDNLNKGATAYEVMDGKGSDLEKATAIYNLFSETDEETQVGEDDSPEVAANKQKAEEAKKKGVLDIILGKGTDAEKVAEINEYLHSIGITSDATYSAVETAGNVYDVVKGNKSDAEKAGKVSELLYDAGVIDLETLDTVNTGLEAYGIATDDSSGSKKTERTAELLFEKGVIDLDGYNALMTAAGASNSDKSDAEKTKIVNQYLYDSGKIDQKTYDSINGGLDIYEGTKGSASDAEKAKALSSILLESGAISPEYYEKFNELASTFNGNMDDIIEYLTSEESTLLDTETKKTVANSYETYKAGSDTYDTIKNGSTSDRAKLGADAANDNGLLDDDLKSYLDTTADLYGIYEKEGWEGVLKEMTKGSEEEAKNSS